jgi:hypothetical protein
MSKVIGKGVLDRWKEATSAVYGLLPEDCSEIQWSKIKEKASERRISPSTLSAHLKDFVKWGAINRRVDTSGYPPKVYYSKRRFLPPSKEKSSIPTDAQQLASAEDVDEFLEGATRSYISFLLGFITLMFRAGTDMNYDFRKDKTEEVRPWNSIGQAKQVLDNVVDVMFRDWAHQLLELLYLSDPRNGKLLLYNEKIWKQIHVLDQLGSQMVSTHFKPELLELINEKVWPEK